MLIIRGIEAQYSDPRLSVEERALLIQHVQALKNEEAEKLALIKKVNENLQNIACVRHMLPLLEKALATGKPVSTIRSIQLKNLKGFSAVLTIRRNDEPILNLTFKHTDTWNYPLQLFAGDRIVLTSQKTVNSIIAWGWGPLFWSQEVTAKTPQEFDLVIDGEEVFLKLK